MLALDRPRSRCATAHPLVVLRHCLPLCVLLPLSFGVHCVILVCDPAGAWSIAAVGLPLRPVGQPPDGGGGLEDVHARSSLGHLRLVPGPVRRRSRGLRVGLQLPPRHRRRGRRPARHGDLPARAVAASADGHGRGRGHAVHPEALVAPSPGGRGGPDLIGQLLVPERLHLPGAFWARHLPTVRASPKRGIRTVVCFVPLQSRGQGRIRTVVVLRAPHSLCFSRARRTRSAPR